MGGAACAAHFSYASTLISSHFIIVSMKTSDFEYELPSNLIAQTPVEPRDSSRLMVLNRADGAISHRRFYELDQLLHKGDMLVFNDSRVMPARLIGRKADTGGKVELLLLRRLEPGLWETVVKPSRSLRVGVRVELAGLEGEIVERGEGAVRIVRFSDEQALERAGQVPLPPYIRRPLDDPERYQTIYSRVKGSAAAPTAGLHFTPGLLQRLEAKGVQFVFVTLHVGLDTFSPVRVEDPSQHIIHKEYGELSSEVAQQLTLARGEGRRIVAVGTTSVRLLEQSASKSDGIQPFEGMADLFILPGQCFRVVDAMITNFHLPRTTLLMLVAAFAGQSSISKAYQVAIEIGYRFYSFGDAMLIV
jgi:S-adenosylmethionine:tRNA ribosyltransferase-isomerase